MKGTELIASSLRLFPNTEVMDVGWDGEKTE
jgi:hypothetical protein